MVGGRANKISSIRQMPKRIMEGGKRADLLPFTTRHFFHKSKISARKNNSAHSRRPTPIRSGTRDWNGVGKKMKPPCAHLQVDKESNASLHGLETKTIECQTERYFSTKPERWVARWDGYIKTQLLWRVQIRRPGIGVTDI